MKYFLLVLVLIPFLSEAQTPLSNNLQVNAPKALDNRTGVFKFGVWRPYYTISEANTNILSNYRYNGLTVPIGTINDFKEYWYRGGIVDDSLVLKTTPLPQNFTYQNIYSTSATPTVALGSGAGTGATYLIQGSNESGILRVGTGTSPTTGQVLAVLTLAGFTFPTKCVITLQPYDGNTAGIYGGQQIYANSSDGSSITILTGSIALSASTTYTWNYIIKGY